MYNVILVFLKGFGEVDYDYDSVGDSDDFDIRSAADNFELPTAATAASPIAAAPAPIIPPQVGSSYTNNVIISR